MKKKAIIVDKAIEQTAKGLRMIGFDFLEGKVATLQLWPLRQMMVIKLGRDPKAEVPYRVIRVKNGYAYGEEDHEEDLIEFTQRPFGKNKIAYFGDSTITNPDGEESRYYMQYPNK